MPVIRGLTVMLTILGTFVAVDNTALNVVCNQEYAQVVPHVRLILLLPSFIIFLSTPDLTVSRFTTI